ncbi:hypothetical protein [Halobacillus sp. A5]|uniref:hypothetical protein n=1 Tax=Halobacillus sp. A5 TaxID=2880263 RepID=UPI0020A6B1BA|nr:hypothetical protein [Halobacillus sp. A5]MCP3029650.1 hypothetical protein [Halobacillus sp. A5]
MKHIFMFVFIFSTLLLVACSDVGTGAEAEDTELNYHEELTQVAEDIISNSTRAEEMVNTYSYMWSSAIKNNLYISDVTERLDISESQAKDYFETTGFGTTNVIADDFNKVISGLGEYYSSNGQIEEIESSSESIQTKIKELNTPPADYEKVYDKVVELYTMSEEYKELAIKPSGSLMTFNQTSEQLSTDIVSNYKEIEVIMPNSEQNKD